MQRNTSLASDRRLAPVGSDHQPALGHMLRCVEPVTHLRGAPEFHLRCGDALPHQRPRRRSRDAQRLARRRMTHTERPRHVRPDLVEGDCSRFRVRRRNCLVVRNSASMVRPASSNQGLVEPEPTRLGHTPGLEELATDPVSIYRETLEHQNRFAGAGVHRRECIARYPAPDDDHIEFFSRERPHHCSTSDTRAVVPKPVSSSAPTMSSRVFA